MFIVIPLKLLETLTCTQCHFYLSTRVKVYKNGKIKCERCSRENDGGTISKLYETVLKNTLFPCVNHYSGCRDLLHNYEVPQHEVICPNKQFIYDCLLCSTYNPSIAYSLQYHLENVHEDYSLAKPEFFVNLSHLNQNLSYYYKEGSLISFIFSKYEAESYKFTFNVFCAMHEPFRNVRYRLSIFNVDNKKLYRTRTMFCSKYTEDIEVDIARVMHLVRDKIVFVRLEIFEDSILMTPENIIYLNPTLSAAKFTCKFHNISLFQVSTIGYSKIYYVGDLPWRVEISKHSTEEEEPNLSIYLTTENEIPYTCNVNASFTLISTEPKDCRTDFFGKDFQNIDGGGFDDVLKWRYLVDSSNFGYIDNDAITIDVWLEVGAEKLHEYRRANDYKQCKAKKRVRFV